MKSSTNGEIVFTKTGLIHKGDTERFDYEKAERERAAYVNGRPTNEFLEGLKFDFSAFNTPFELPKFVGARVIKF